MIRLRDALNPQDLAHFRQILGGTQDPNPDETMRRSRVKQMSTDHTYLSRESVAQFQGLGQEDRERLLSDIVWRLTCHVEGSITKSPGRGVPLECGFRIRLADQDGREIFVVKKG
jgi:hypothetical protein